MKPIIKKVKCPKCGETLTVEITEKVLSEAEMSASGVTAIMVPHSDHQAIVYIDKEAGIRGVDWAVLPSKPVINLIREVPIPSPNPPDPRALTRDEWRFLALCDGTRDLREISQLLNIPIQKARLMTERLRSRGYLERVELVM